MEKLEFTPRLASEPSFIFMLRSPARWASREDPPRSARAFPHLPGALLLADHSVSSQALNGRQSSALNSAIRHRVLMNSPENICLDLNCWSKDKYLHL